MNNYHEMMERHQTEVNNFPMFFALDNKAFIKGMQKLGLKPEDTDKIYKLGDTGGYYRCSDDKKLKSIFKKHREEMQAAINADKKGTGFIYEMFYSALSGCEYNFTEDSEPALEILGLSMEEITKNKNLLRGFNKAIKAQKDCFTKRRKTNKKRIIDNSIKVDEEAGIEVYTPVPDQEE